MKLMSDDAEMWKAHRKNLRARRDERERREVAEIHRMADEGRIAFEVLDGRYHYRLWLPEAPRRSGFYWPRSGSLQIGNRVGYAATAEEAVRRLIRETDPTPRRRKRP